MAKRIFLGLLIEKSGINKYFTSSLRKRAYSFLDLAQIKDFRSDRIVAT